MALVRQPIQGLRSLLEADSVVEAMTANLLASTGRGPTQGEVRSWRASLPVLVNDVIAAGLPNVEILVEHQLPLTSRRVDAILAGNHPKTKEPSYVLVELKQWGSAENYDDAPGLVRLDAYGHRPVLHPIDQVDGYRQYLLDFLPALAEQPNAVAAIAYLHNATEHGIQDLRDREPTDLVRLFSGERKQDFYDFLRQRLDPEVPGTQSADLLMGMRAGPSRQLLAVAADEIRDREQFVLLDEQRVAYEIVMHTVRQAHAADNKTVIIVTGGPGTGKSVIALSLLGELARQGRSVLHATGSQSFTKTLRKVAGRGSTRTQQLFKYFNSFVEAERNCLDVLILDEAHRIRETSANRYTKASARTGRAQLDELIAAARVPVFLLDEHQVVRPGELGSVSEIEGFCQGLGLQVQLVSLEDQFRCGGSAAYVRWVHALLGLTPGGPIPWSGDDRFTVQVVESPGEMESLLSVKQGAGFTARMTAGFCWPWSDPERDGTLVPDGRIGDWQLPWNLKGDRAIGGAPPSALWATDPAGFGQVGCIYTAQGFEYDWNGIIFGPDLVWRGDRWLAVRSGSRDPALRSEKSTTPEEFDALLRNVYKVLLTRGMLGTLLFSTDAETQAHFRSLT
ncbi:MAG: DNA/RNA helicase domain-containing protein [Actinomycetales bacterium]